MKAPKKVQVQGESSCELSKLSSEMSSEKDNKTQL
jgi:hypothetical protein